MTGRYLPDANIYLHALNLRSPHHAACRGWLDRVTAASDVLLVNDLTECALLRIGTLPQLGFATVAMSLKFWEKLGDYPGMERAIPGADHRALCSGFIRDLKLRGNDINDAWLAALAIENRATLVSTDLGFARFPRLHWLNPLVPKKSA